MEQITHVARNLIFDARNSGVIREKEQSWHQAFKFINLPVRVHIVKDGASFRFKIDNNNDDDFNLASEFITEIKRRWFTGAIESEECGVKNCLQIFQKKIERRNIAAQDKIAQINAIAQKMKEIMEQAKTAELDRPTNLNKADQIQEETKPIQKTTFFSDLFSFFKTTKNKCNT